MKNIGAWSMVMAGINPHRFGFAGTDKAALLVKFNCASIGYQDVLMEARIPGHQHFHDSRPNALTLIFWMDEQMRVIDHQMAIGNGVAQTDEPGSIPSGSERMGFR